VVHAAKIAAYASDMNQGPYRAAALALALALGMVPVAARADGTADEADLHFRMGTRDFARGDYEGALAHFLYSNRLVPNRNVLFNIATAFEQLKRYVDAHRYYVDALEGEADPGAQAAVRAGIARVAPHVAVLGVETVPPGATIYVNRRDLGSAGRAPRPLALPAGRHRIIVELEGYEPKVADEIDLVQGAERKISLSLVRIVGTVRVAVEGGKAATVRVDDERGAPACQAPCDLELPPGPHQLYFTAEAAQAEPRALTVVARGVTNTSAVLRPLTGAIVVEADERGALVTVDGKPSGFTPTVLQGVPAGRRRLRVSMPGYAPVELEVDVKPGRQAETPMVRLVPAREVEAVSRYSQSIDDAPSSVTIVSREELAAFGFPTIAAALLGVRGLAISNDRAYASAGVRGLGQPDDYNNRLLVLADGQSLNENIGASSAIGSNARVDLHDVDRIEVVRGPGSLLYGTGAFSGVVNLVSRPRDEPSGVHLGFGVYDDAVIHGRAGFHYNHSKDVGMWASVSTAHSEGYDLAVPGAPQASGPAATQVAHKVEAFSSVNTAGRAWWGPATLQWFYQYRNQVVPVGAYGAPFDDPGTTLGDTRMMAELRVEPRLSSTVELLLRAHADRYVSHETFAAPSGQVPSEEDYTGTWFGGEARLVVTPLSWLRLTGGGEYQGHPQATMTGVTLSPAGPPSPYLDEKHPYQFGAGYLLGEASPRPWVRVTAGARVDGYSFGPIVVPRAGLIFKPGGGGVLKITGGRAFRAPSVYEQFYSAPNYQIPGDDPARGYKLSPESIWSGEVEYSHRFFEDWVALAAGYAGYVEGLIDTIADPATGLKRYANSTSPALLAGGDVEIRREFRRGWMLSASYGYERAQFLSSSLSGPRLLNAPEHMASFRGIAPVLRDLVIAALRLTLEAPRRIGFDAPATTSTALIADATVSGNVRDYGLHYTVGVYNIADVRYAVPVSSTFVTPTLPQNGRTFLFDVTATYP
jgi:outer membrane receptor protein involved in Fe transport